MKKTLTTLVIICTLTAFGQTSQKHFQNGITQHEHQGSKGVTTDKDVHYNETGELAVKDFKAAANSGKINLRRKQRGVEPVDFILSDFVLTCARIGNSFYANGTASQYPFNLEYNVETKNLIVTITVNNTVPIIWNHTVDARWKIVYDDTTLYITWLDPKLLATNNRPEYRILANSTLMLKVDK